MPTAHGTAGADQHDRQGQNVTTFGSSGSANPPSFAAPYETQTPSVTRWSTATKSSSVVARSAPRHGRRARTPSPRRATRARSRGTRSTPRSATAPTASIRAAVDRCGDDKRADKADAVRADQRSPDEPAPSALGAMFVWPPVLGTAVACREVVACKRFEESTVLMGCVRQDACPSLGCRPAQE